VLGVCRVRAQLVGFIGEFSDERAAGGKLAWRKGGLNRIMTGGGGGEGGGGGAGRRRDVAQLSYNSAISRALLNTAVRARIRGRGRG
jgi:hypothetical protein